MTPDTRIQAARLVERTCRQSGVPLLVGDPSALARLAGLLGPTTTSGADGTASPIGSAVLPRPRAVERETRRRSGPNLVRR